MPEIITSPANPKIKDAVRIRKSPSAEAFVIEGFHLVEMAREKNLLCKVLAVKDPGFPEVDTVLVPLEIIEKISSSKTPEPILGIARLPKGKDSLGKRILLLDRLQDPGNVGTLIRTALAFGFEDVVFVPGTCSPMNSKSIAASQGAVFGAQLHFLKDSVSFVEALKKDGYRIIGSALKDSRSLDGFAVSKEEPMALIIGNEGQGMSESLLAICDDVVRIPMGNIDSLNAAIAGGILMERFSTFH